MSSKIETLWKTYEAISDLIKFADTKATAILAVDGIILSLYFGNTEIINKVISQNLGGLGIFIAALASLLISLAFSASCIIPRLLSDGKCLLFFCDINKSFLSPEAYKKEIEKVKRKEIESQISKQIWQISKIATKKYRGVKYALVFFVLAAVFSAGTSDYSSLK